MMFAPAGLAVKEDSGDVAPIGQGYLIVRSRLRITQDGGQSLLAIPEDSADMMPSAASATSRSTSALSSQSPSGPMSTNSSVFSSQASSSPVQVPSVPTSQDVKNDDRPLSPSGHRSSFLRTTSNTAPQAFTVPKESSENYAVSAAQPSAFAQGTELAPTSSGTPMNHSALLAFLGSQHAAGTARVPWSVVGEHRSKNISSYSQAPTTLGTILASAEADGDVVTGGQAPNLWVKLSAMGQEFSSPALARFAGMVAFLREERLAGNQNISWIRLGIHRAANPSLYAGLPKSLKATVTEAKSLGLVALGGIAPKEWVKLQIP
jgi:hypothetical protein